MNNWDLSYVDKIDLIERLKSSTKITEMQLDYLKSLDTCIDFHASCILDIFDFLTGKAGLQGLDVF